MTAIQHALIIPPDGYITEDPHNPGTIGTKVRVHVAGGLIRRGTIPQNVIVPFPQGRSPQSKENPHRPLGSNVANYVATLPEFNDADIRTLSETWGTWADTLKSYRMIDALAPRQPIHVHFVSDGAQLGRLRIMWFFTHPYGWGASFHEVPNVRTLKDVWTHEPVSYAELLFCKIPTYLFSRLFFGSVR